MKPSYQKSSKTSPAGINVGTWMPAEDARLKDAVARYGPRWVLVASEVATRTGDQCAKRWNENLNPELDHGPWSPNEDQLLLHLVSVYGHDWKSMANNFFEKRAPLALKNRNSLLKRRQKRQAQTTASGQQSPSVGSPAPSMPLTPRYQSYSDFAHGMSNSFYADGADSGTSSPYPQSVMDGDFPLYKHSNVGPDADLADMFANAASATGSPVMGCLSAVPHHMAIARTSEPTSAPDHTAWQSFVGSSPAFAPIPDETQCPELDGYTFVSNTMLEGSPDGTVEYSVTCPRANLQNLVGHLVDAAMTGTSTPMFTDENQVTLTLRLQSV